MINFLKFFFLFFFFLDFFMISQNQNNIINDLFLFYFILFLLLNYFFIKKNYNRLDLDLIFKYLILIFKTPNFLVNYIINIFKKIYLFCFFFKYKHVYNTIIIFLKKHSINLFIWWKPIFKKTSYFGYYRSNRSKWIK